jgi:NADH-quinone oxidoreductase subunit G
MTEIQQRTDQVTLTIDGVEVTAAKGELVIRVAERLGIAIPRFCDHPLLAPAGACRQCLVDVEGQRKPVASCTQTVADGMVVKTQLTSEVARKAQAGIMEFLLINHPLDCPVCDKGGECPLQNQAMSSGRPESRFHEQKREFVKPIPISTQVLLDRERCVLCQRCTRFSDEIAGDRFIDLMERSSQEQIGVYVGDRDDPTDDEPFNSYFSGNTVQICPVGALTGTQYRFRARPFDLVSTPNMCEHCSAGCAQRADHRRGKVMRRWAGDDPEVNEEWNCDKGRWAFQYANATDRLTAPLVRDARTGELREASWPEALSRAAAGLTGAGSTGVLTGGRLTVEDAYAYAKFARVVLGTNNVDFRARPLSEEETGFLGAAVAGRTDVHYADLETAPAVVIAGLEPEEECPILYLRLRKAWRKRKLPVVALAPFASPGLSKIGATVLPTAPGDEAGVLTESTEVRAALTQPGAVLIVGERLAGFPGALSAAASLAERTGARLAWVPRRAGDRGAIEAGCLPTLLPGARPVGNGHAHAEIANVWQADEAISGTPGLDTDRIIAAAAAGTLGGLLVGGVDPADLADPELALRALDEVGFLVSLEIRHSAVTERADVVLPVSPAVEKSGSYLNWEGRLRSFDVVLRTTALSDARVLDAIAHRAGVRLGCGTVPEIRAEFNALGATRAGRLAPPRVSASDPARPARGQAVLASWHQLIDDGRMLDGDPHLAGTARPAVARIGKGTATELGFVDGEPLTISTARGSITLPALITDDLLDEVVWVPTNSPGSPVRRALAATEGTIVTLSAGGAR